jgi:hypothetical protein
MFRYKIYHTHLYVKRGGSIKDLSYTEMVAESEEDVRKKFRIKYPHDTIFELIREKGDEGMFKSPGVYTVEKDHSEVVWDEVYPF